MGIQKASENKLSENEKTTSSAEAVSKQQEPELPHSWKRVVITIWIGQAFSILTAYSSMYAGVWYVTETTDSAFMLAVASLCSMLPHGLLSPIGGVIADRFNRKYVLMAADAFVGAMALIMGMIIMMGHVSVELVLIMSALRSVGQALHIPAMESTMPLLVPKRHLVRINTRKQGLWSLALIVGPVDVYKRQARRGRGETRRHRARSFGVSRDEGGAARCLRRRNLRRCGRYRARAPCRGGVRYR